MSKESKHLNSGRITLQVSAAIEALFVIFQIYAITTSRNYLFFLFVVPYLLALMCAYLSLSGRTKSEMARRLILLLNLTGTVSVIFFLWVYLTLPQNLTW